MAPASSTAGHGGLGRRQGFSVRVAPKSIESLKIQAVEHVEQAIEIVRPLG